MSDEVGTYRGLASTAARCQTFPCRPHERYRGAHSAEEEEEEEGRTSCLLEGEKEGKAEGVSRSAHSIVDSIVVYCAFVSQRR